MRLHSHSEHELATKCGQAWDFRYGGLHTGGVTYATREPILQLFRGIVWGAGIAAYHDRLQPLHDSPEGAASRAFHRAADAEVSKLVKHGYPFAPADEMRRDVLAALVPIFRAYVSSSQGRQRLLIDEAEAPFVVPIPGLPGHAFHGYLDGVARGSDVEGDWLLEVKLRSGEVTPPHIARLLPQLRTYAWAYQRHYGRRVAGVVLDEWVATTDVPSLEVARNKPKKGEAKGALSKRQSCTAARYIAACADDGVEPDADVVASLTKRWESAGFRHVIHLSEREIADAQRDVRSRAVRIAMAEAGLASPSRDASKASCRRCDYAELCPDPAHRDLGEALYRITTPKRLRPPTTERA